MKLEFNKDQLINALGIVSRAIPVRTTNPILECILFDAGSDEIRLASKAPIGHPLIRIAPS